MKSPVAVHGSSIDPGGAKRVDETVVAKRRRSVVGRAFDESETAMAKRDEMLANRPARRALVDADARTRCARACSPAEIATTSTPARCAQLEQAQDRPKAAGTRSIPAGRSRSRIADKSRDGFSACGIDRAGDEVEPKRRAGAQRAKLQARIVISCSARARGCGRGSA